MPASPFNHFILTRFNLLIFNKDKEGQKVRTTEWLEHRLGLFERYCLPSVANQTCRDFTWIVLFDSKTPDQYKTKIEEYQARCPQLVPVFVEPQNGRFFASIFRAEVSKRLQPGRVITTYLDNDDALDRNFVKDIQERADTLSDGTFITYTHGYQFFTEHQYLMRVRYPRNHFISVAERADPATVKTIYGYGSHYYIDRIPDVKIERIKNRPMWCEVIHEKNMGNDAYFLLGARMVSDGERLRGRFSIDESVRSGLGLYLFRFIPRYIKVFVRRIGYFFFGRHW